MATHSTSPGQSQRGAAAQTAGRSGRAGLEEHISRLRGVLEPALACRGSESLRLASDFALGRISAETVRAPVALPSFDNSQMDGFALRRADRRADDDAGFTLPLAGVVSAGSPAPELPAGACMAVMTGAPVPAGADLVVPVEKTEEGFAVLEDLQHRRKTEVQFVSLAEQDGESGRFIRRAGSDVTAGEAVLRPGEVLTPARLGLLAACGIADVSVRQQVRTLVVATGEEIRAPGDPLEPGQIYDANGPLIRAACQGFGHAVTVAQVASDSPSAFTTQLDSLLTDHCPHLVITAGGISAGAYEVVRQALTGRGVEFGSVAQQPGGPQGWGMLDSAGGPAALVALPGNPVSCAVSLETLLRPALAELDPGCPRQRRASVRVGERLSSPPGLRQFRRVELRDGDGAPVAVPVGGPSSHLIGHLAAADALLELYEDDIDVQPGTIREAILL